MKERIPLVAYSINNMYLSGIHAGIQSAHSLVELSMIQETKMRKDVPVAGNWFKDLGGHGSVFEGFTKRQLFNEWAENHKTIIVLNGGNGYNMHKIAKLISESGYPYSCFLEPDIDPSSDVLTNVSVVMPNAQELCDSVSVLHDKSVLGNYDFYNTISRLRLMN